MTNLLFTTSSVLMPDAVSDSGLCAATIAIIGMKPSKSSTLCSAILCIDVTQQSILEAPDFSTELFETPDLGLA
jgi:hypothetical protein